MTFSFIMDAWLFSYIKTDSVNDVISWIGRVIVYIVVSSIILVFLIPSENAEALVCTFYIRAIAIHLGAFLRFHRTGENIFNSNAFLLSSILSISSQALQCYCAFAGDRADTLFIICVVVFSLSLFIQITLCVQFYQMNGPCSQLSVSNCNSCIYLFTYVTASVIYAILVVACNGAYSIVPLVTSNYIYCIFALTATFVEKRTAVTEVILLKEVYKMFCLFYLFKK